MNTSKHGRGARPGPRKGGGREQNYWMFGRHAVTAACLNPARQVLRLLAVEPERWQDLGHPVQGAQRHELERLLPAGVVHQGIAALVEPLEQPAWPECCLPEAGETALTVVLDQVEDTQNVGTILRSAAAFGARAVILPERHAPPESGLLARAASGMLERVPLLRVTNLARALDDLAGLGYWRYGLAAGGEARIADAGPGRHVALVLGAEGRGLRRLTEEHCDVLVSIPMAAGVESLNVAAAAAIAMHEIYRINH